ncbi:MAG: ABC transporter ATP-binding protein [Lautropia sp.]|nr:ABC transporter ATP-binding protein [Lautropia sp.]
MSHPPTPSPPLTDQATLPELQLDGVRLVRGTTQVFEGLNLRLGEQRIGLIGHNGVGKTSLLRLLCGLEVPEAGSVRRNGLDIHQEADGRQRSQWLGMMFQNPDDQIIFPIVEEELALGLQPQGYKKREAIEEARRFLAERGLSDWAGRAIASLSQGQRQRVCWLAMLLAGPATLLLDEPYASLDLPGQARLADELWASNRQLVVSTHLLDHVRHYPRVIWLDEGRIRADGPGEAVCVAYEDQVRELVAVRRGQT